MDNPRIDTISSLPQSKTLTLYDQDGHSVDVLIAHILNGIAETDPNVLNLCNDDLFLCSVRKAVSTAFPEADVHKLEYYCKGGCHHIVNVELATGQKLIARVCRTDHNQWSPASLAIKCKGERAVIKALKQHTHNVPVADIYSINTIRFGSYDCETPWMLVERVGQTGLINVYDCLTMEQKISIVKQLASILGDVFNITSDLCGSANDFVDDEFIIGAHVNSTRIGYPILPPGKYTVNDIAEGYISILRKLAPGEDAKRAIEALDYVRLACCNSNEDEIKNEERRYHLFHIDMRMSNIFVSSSICPLRPTSPATSDIHISALIDWDLHAFLPSSLAADYPHWLRYEGYYDPVFHPRGGMGGGNDDGGKDDCGAVPYLWEESGEAMKVLRRVFREAVQTSHPKFYASLIKGSSQRQLLHWLSGFAWHDLKSYTESVETWAEQFGYSIPVAMGTCTA